MFDTSFSKHLEPVRVWVGDNGESAIAKEDLLRVVGKAGKELAAADLQGAVEVKAGLWQKMFGGHTVTARGNADNLVTSREILEAKGLSQPARDLATFLQETAKANSQVTHDILGELRATLEKNGGEVSGEQLMSEVSSLVTLMKAHRILPFEDGSNQISLMLWSPEGSPHDVLLRATVRDVAAFKVSPETQKFEAIELQLLEKPNHAEKASVSYIIKYDIGATARSESVSMWRDVREGQNKLPIQESSVDSVGSPEEVRNFRHEKAAGVSTELRRSLAELGIAVDG
ncbi:MAG: hypothetical protein ACOZIN_11410 [Myxococcota bacterium]